MDAEALAERISNSIRELESAAQEQQAAQQDVLLQVEALRDAHSSRTSIARRARQSGVELSKLPSNPHKAVSKGLDTLSVIDATALDHYAKEIAAWDAGAIVATQAAVPTPATERERTLVDLGALSTEARTWREALHRDGKLRAAFSQANRVFTRFQERQHQHFDEVIQQISQSVAEMCRFLHQNSGISEVAVETVGEKGAELSVNYYGRRELPPHRVLSESRMNSLGLALFLAMAETFNDTIGFLVLDDVVNSFDREHRGRLADLLVEKFPDTQLIVLTHDEQFFTRICTLAPSWTREQFTSWSYEEGPRTKRYENDRLLTDARESLSAGDLMGAANKGRVALEEFLQEACEELEALLPFRRGPGNDQRMADEVMKGLRRTLKRRAKPFYPELDPLLTALEADLQAALNWETHASQGTTANQEVRDALDRVDKLRDHFTCVHCATRIWHRGTPEASRCKCGESTFPPPNVIAASAPA